MEKIYFFLTPYKIRCYSLAEQDNTGCAQCRLAFSFPLRLQRKTVPASPPAEKKTPDPKSECWLYGDKSPMAPEAKNGVS